MDTPQPPVPAGEDVFELGLTLAGAISAGAYTAGVLDFLFQALDEWETAKRLGTPGVPGHRVVIPVITGASAGAITGALSAVALARGLHPVRMTDAERANCFPSHGEDDQPFRCVLPALWRTWVELPDMLDSGGKPGLLGLGDLRKDASVASLLDSTVLDRIRDAAIDAPADPGQRGLGCPVRFISRSLHVYMTLSNMRGIPYRVSFGRGGSDFGMMTHGDRVHYVVEGLGCGPFTAGPWLADDTAGASLPLSVADLPAAPGEAREARQGWYDYGNAALASAAFPGGLAPRALGYVLSSYKDRRLPIDLPIDLPGPSASGAKLDIRLGFPAAMGDGTFTFQTVDGGVVNNSPFDYAQFALWGHGPRQQDRDGGSRAILMVAPFPDPPKLPPEGTPKGTLAAIGAALVPALINQARFRTSELAPAWDGRDYTRFLVAPKRRVPSDTRRQPGETPPHPEDFAIACGLLGGFGGFLHESFRAHDFQLGRRNCQNFLRDRLTVKAGGTVQGRASHNPDTAVDEVPVIPLLGSAAHTVPQPRWPQIGRSDLDRLKRGIGARMGGVVPALIRGQTRRRKLRAALRFGWRAFLHRPVLDAAMDAITVDLVRRGQLREHEPPPGAVAAAARHGLRHEMAAAVLAELFLGRFPFRTAAGIAKAAAEPRNAVEAVLHALSDPATPAVVRTWHGPGCWTLWDRRPPAPLGWWPLNRLWRRWNARDEG